MNLVSSLRSQMTGWAPVTEYADQQNSYGGQATWSPFKRKLRLGRVAGSKYWHSVCTKFSLERTLWKKTELVEVWHLMECFQVVLPLQGIKKIHEQCVRCCHTSIMKLGLCGGLTPLERVMPGLWGGRGEGWRWICVTSFGKWWGQVRRWISKIFH